MLGYIVKISYDPGNGYFLRAIGRGLMIAGVIYITGCAPAFNGQLNLTKAAALDTMDRGIQETFFTEEAMKALGNSPIYIADLGQAKKRNVVAEYAGNNRIIEKSVYESSKRLEEIIFHESIHHLEEAGLISGDDFMVIYDKMPENPPDTPSSLIEQKINYMLELLSLSGKSVADTELVDMVLHEIYSRMYKYYPIKKTVEKIIKKHYRHSYFADSERIAHTAVLWKFRGFDIPEEMKIVFSRAIKINSGRHIPGTLDGQLK
jgi:hypothetical protein